MPNPPRPLSIAGAYPLLIAIMTGAAWLDGVYARELHAAFRDDALHGVFSAVSDALLLPMGLALLAGVVACVLTSGRARWLCIGSLGVLSLQLLLPMLVGAIPRATVWFDGHGMLVRQTIMLGALVCAIFSLREAAK